MLVVLLTKSTDIYGTGNIIQSTFFFLWQTIRLQMLNTSYLLNTVESLEILVLNICGLCLFHIVEIKSKTNHEQSFWTGSSTKSMSLKQCMEIGPNDSDDSTLSFYCCQMFIIYARKILHSGALMLLFKSISMCESVITCIHVVHLYNTEFITFDHANKCFCINNWYLHVNMYPLSNNFI